MKALDLAKVALFALAVATAACGQTYMVKGMQGHVGYPQKAKNPIPALAELITQLAIHKLDKGTEHFDASTLAFTSVDVGNDATNVIPGEARAAFNIRFNDKHTPDSLTNWVKDRALQIARSLIALPLTMLMGA